MGESEVYLERKQKCAHLYVVFSSYDKIVIKYRWIDADINFNIEDYEDDLKLVMMNLSYIT